MKEFQIEQSELWKTLGISDRVSIEAEEVMIWPIISKENDITDR